jgi:hypothetical protein
MVYFLESRAAFQKSGEQSGFDGLHFRMKISKGRLLVCILGNKPSMAV